MRLEEAKLCLLVLIGVRADGRKELVALTDGYREASESSADLLRDCKRRGMRAPVLAIGDGPLGFWGALREVFPLVPQDCECSCRAAEIGAPGGEEGARGDLERRGQTARAGGGQGVRGGLRRQVPQGGRQDHRRCRPAAGLLRLPGRALGAPENDESDIESTFATARNRSKITKGPGSRAQGIAMACKLIEAAQSRWRAVNAPHPARSDCRVP